MSWYRFGSRNSAPLLIVSELSAPVKCEPANVVAGRRRVCKKIAARSRIRVQCRRIGQENPSGKIGISIRESPLDDSPPNCYPPPMRTSPMSWIRLLVLLFLLGNSTDSMYAQEITFSGVGPINHSLAGTAVALPRDSAGAIYWNPATISFLDYSEFQLGMGRHNAPWYGDEYVVGTALVVGVVVLVLIAVTDDNKSDSNNDTMDWEGHQRQNNNWLILDFHIGCSDDCYHPHPAPRPADEPEPRAPRNPAIRVPTLSYLYRPLGSRWSYGLGISEYGAIKTGAIEVGDMVGIAEYRFQGCEFMPTVSYRESRRFSIGLSPIFSIDETPNASLPVIPFSQYSGVSQNQRSKAGFGMQIGAFYSPTQRTRFGVSVRTPQWINGFTYRWADPVTGNVNTQRLSFSQDSAFRIAVGASRTLRNDKTTFSADFRYADYSHASALYDIPASFDSTVRWQGSSRGVYSLAVSGEHRPWDILAFRMGYQWNHAVTPDKAIIYNTSLPIQSGHSIHYGLTAFFNEHLDLSLSASNAFGGGMETLHTENGSVNFRRNPNGSNFWIAGRFRF